MYILSFNADHARRSIAFVDAAADAIVLAVHRLASCFSPYRLSATAELPNCRGTIYPVPRVLLIVLRQSLMMSNIPSATIFSSCPELLLWLQPELKGRSSLLLNGSSSLNAFSTVSGETGLSRISQARLLCIYFTGHIRLCKRLFMNATWAAGDLHKAFDKWSSQKPLPEGARSKVKLMCEYCRKFDDREVRCSVAPKTAVGFSIFRLESRALGVLYSWFRAVCLKRRTSCSIKPYWVFDSISVHAIIYAQNEMVIFAQLHWLWLG